MLEASRCASTRPIPRPYVPDEAWCGDITFIWTQEGWVYLLLCPRCHCPMKLKSFLTSGKSLQRLLSRLGEPTDVQGKAPARGPAYFASQLLRRRFAEHTTQLDMLD